ncbi:hypothetical protein KP509_18G079500 [Ceratopteris richardii]|nr:hypothetical protein KP509_18G079500 [Ceratopteris richardii]
MQSSSVSPSEFTFSLMLKACTKVGCIDVGRHLHSHIIKNGVEDNVYIGNTLVDMYAKFGSLIDSQEVFDSLADQDLVSWNALITGYVENGLAKEALHCFEDLQERTLSPNVTTYLSVVKACSILHERDLGKQVHLMILKEEFETDEFLGNTLVDMYAKFGLLEEAREIFEDLPVKDIVSWNALITGYALHEYFSDVLVQWKEMQHEGIAPNTGTFVRLLQVCGAIEEIGTGKEIHTEVVLRGFDNEFFVGDTLVDMYSKCRLFEDAQMIFDRLLVHDAVTWNALITGCSADAFKDDAMGILLKMEGEEISPDSVTLSTILRACSALGALEEGMRIHLEVMKRGFEDCFTGCSLMDLYAKCNSFLDCQSVFSEIPDRDVACWNVLISGFADQGMNTEALNRFEQMQCEGVHLNPETFVCILQSCTIDIGRTLHANLVQEKFEQISCVSSALVNMYVKNGLLSEAYEVFSDQIFHDIISWTALISGFVEGGLTKEAFNFYKQMRMEGQSPSLVTLVCLLKACELESLDEGRKFHAMIVKRGDEGDSLIGAPLVSIYAVHGELSEAEKLFEKLPARNTALWTALIAGYTDHGKFKEALTCFEKMQDDGIPPDLSTYVWAFQACCGLKDLDMGLALYTVAVKSGIEQATPIGSVLVELFTKCGMHVESREIFDSLPVCDLFTWTTLISGYVQCGYMEEAVNCLRDMQTDGITPDAVVWDLVISGYAEYNDYEKTVELSAMMQQQGLLPDTSILLNIVHSCTCALVMEVGKRVHAQVVNLSGANSLFESAFIDLYGKCGNVNYAEKVFQGFPTKDLIPWNSLLISYALQGESKAVSLLLERMIELNINPDGNSFQSTFIVCSHAGLLFESHCYYQLMKYCFGIMPTIKHLTCFVDLVARAGQLSFARIMVETMPFQPDLVLLHAMLSGCRILGNVQLGHEVFAFAKSLDRGHAAAYVLMSNIYIEDPLSIYT